MISVLFKRGIIIHKLLELLPNIENKSVACREFLQNEKHDLSEPQIKQIEQEVLKIFDDHANLFGENSYAEVPIIGTVDGVKYSGFIDRICIEDDCITIVDYKSNRPPAETAEETPEVYKKQLSIYKEVMKNIYPNRTIKMAILWTNTSKLIELG